VVYRIAEFVMVLGAAVLKGFGMARLYTGFLACTTSQLAERVGEVYWNARFE
jgi:hypothetical protein